MNTKRIKRTIAFAISQYYPLLIIGIIIVVCGLGYLIFVRGIVSDIQQTGDADLQAQFRVYDERQATLDDLEDLSGRYQKLTTAQLNQLASVLPTASDIPQVMIEVKNFIEQNKLDLVSLDSGPLTAIDPDTTTAATAKELNISLTIDGIASYYQFKSFLDDISTQLPLMELNSITYTPDTTSYTLNLTLHYK